MGMSKVYRGYVIEDIDGQWYIHNAPTWTNMNAFSPGPHCSWTIATHQVDKLIEYINRNQNSNVNTQESNSDYVSHGSSNIEPGGLFNFIFNSLLLVWIGLIIVEVFKHYF